MSIELNVGPRVRQVRKRRGYTVDDLVMRLELAGVDNISRDTIYRLEKNQQAMVRLNLVLQVALVLDVSPLVLLLPADGGMVDLTPTMSVPAVAVYEWIVGTRPAPTAGPINDLAKAKAHADLQRELPFTVFHSPNAKSEDVSIPGLAHLMNNPKIGSGDEK